MSGSTRHAFARPATRHVVRYRKIVSMPSLVAPLKKQLEGLGEYVVLANLDSGWFAVNPNTWRKRVERGKELGRVGPNLIIHRTLSDEMRDHHVVPNQVISPMLSADSLKQQKNGTYRWNLTLRNDRLHVSHRDGYEPVGRFFASRLATESNFPDDNSEFVAEPVSLRTRFFDGIVEGISRELLVLSRSRSAALRQEALRLSAGFCEGCGVNFFMLLNGRGVQALQVHHKKQLALRETPEATALTDLAVVCANCHAIIHSDHNNAMPLEDLRVAWGRNRGAA